MNVDLTKLTELIEKYEKKHANELRGLSLRTPDYEDGFGAGMKYVRQFIIPVAETDKKDSYDNFLEEVLEELQSIKAQVRDLIEDERNKQGDSEI